MNRIKLSLWLATLIEFDAETRFKAMAAQGNPEGGIVLLDKLDIYFGKEKEQKRSL